MENKKDKKRVYDVKYMRENTKRIGIVFNINNENDMKMLDFMKKQDNKQKYIKDLILKEMKGRQNGKKKWNRINL